MAIRRVSVHGNRGASARKQGGGLGGQNRTTIRTPILLDEQSAATTTVTVIFNQAVILKGVPQYSATVGGGPALPVSAALAAPDELTLVYGANVTGPLIVPFEDPGVRNLAGGYVQPGSYSFLS